MKIENLQSLKIHKLSQEQYDRERDAGNLNPNALYFTPYSVLTDDEKAEMVAEVVSALPVYKGEIAVYTNEDISVVLGGEY